jgi:hypothetical protein
MYAALASDRSTGMHRQTRPEIFHGSFQLPFAEAIDECRRSSRVLNSGTLIFIFGRYRNVIDWRSPRAAIIFDDLLQRGITSAIRAGVTDHVERWYLGP